jgi:sporulation protein YlmC with PRC-barrel domain
MMWTKKGQGLNRISSGFLTAVAFLVFCSSPGLAGEVRGEKTRQQSGKMDLRGGIRASRIIDETVKNDRGEEVGEVDDLIMSRNGKIKKVILSVGGFLGIGDRLVAVQYRSLRIDEKGDTIYNVTKEQLEKHPEFSYRKEGLYGNYFPPYPIYTFPYNPGYYYPENPPYPPYPAPPPYGKPYGPLPEKRHKGGYYYPWTWEYFPERLQVSAILNRNLLNDRGEVVGYLEDLIISPKGKVEQLVASVGGFLEIETKLVGLPFKPLKITDMGIVYDVTRQDLKNLPEFR